MSDDDIEFLDEDAEIVQQCVQLRPIKIEPLDEDEPAVAVADRPETSLLVARSRPNVPKKRKKDEDDSDYDPMVDSPHFNRRRRHPKQAGRKHDASGRSGVQSQSPVRKAAVPRSQADRRRLDIRLPDFDDPLCLPVRALLRDDNDARRLSHWNQLCLERLKHGDAPLRPRDGPTAASKRTVVIRNLFNKYSGKTETTFWSKITVQGRTGETKSDVVQSVLPRYREKKILMAYRLVDSKRRRSFSDRQEVILSKEKSGEDEVLVAYKPQSSLSMIFKMFDSEAGAGGAGGAGPEERRHLQEVGSCSACARCYHAAWRPREHGAARSLPVACPLCARECQSARGLLAHVRTHAPADVRARRQDVSDVLAQLLPHQYRCRVCQRQFRAVGRLRRHLAAHREAGELYCELGNHTVC